MGQTDKSPSYVPTWESLDSRPLPTWFAAAKFGIFIHWGVYSVPAWRPLGDERYASYAEWYYASVIGDHEHGGDAFHKAHYGEQFEYRDFAKLFTAELFDADYWAKLFRRSGAGYVVLTSKHHDGYCLWPTKSPYKKNWNSSAIGPGRDLVGELSSAVRANGLKMGLYYSIIEWESIWTHRVPSGYYVDKALVDKYRIPEDQYVDQHLMPQLRELVEAYQPSLIFSDGGEWDGSEDYWQTKEFLAWLYNEAANRDEVVVNDRWAKGMPGKHGDYFSSEYRDSDAIGADHPWEESRGVGGSYGFNRAENLGDYSTSKELVHELIDVVSRGGNFLLNIGPTADGRIPLLMQERLCDIGAWLEVNGEAIYGTQLWRRPLGDDREKMPTVRYTAKGSDLYAICTEWPQGPFAIAGIGSTEGIEIEMLGLAQPISWRAEGEKLLLSPPEISPLQVPCQHAYCFRIRNALR
ncbi:MAG: alpha-L-fucosidase [Candidatus Latescibacterota bacterium]|jgi:alpha-L-fucosidase